MPANFEAATSLYRLPMSGRHASTPLRKLEETIEYAAQLLPADGPISSFGFLNPLHAFENMPFEKAVKIGGRMFGCEPYLSETRYREEVAAGRIRSIDIRTVLEDDLREKAWNSLHGLCSRLDLRTAMLRCPVLHGPDIELEWFLAETDARVKFRADATAASRKRIVADSLRWLVRDVINQGGTEGSYEPPAAGDPRRKHVLWDILHRFDEKAVGRWSDETWEAFSLGALWNVCQNGVRRAAPAAPDDGLSARPRDLLFQATDVDTDVMVHEVLIRLSAAFTDQGFAYWSLPRRETGFFEAFRDLYRLPGGPPDRWLSGLSAELDRQAAAGFRSLESVHESLQLLGIPEPKWREFLPATVLALRGWAAMIRQMEVRADRFPSPALVGTLTDFLAIRLILERLALAHVARHELGYTGPLQGLRDRLAKRPGRRRAPTAPQRTFVVFQLAQVLGWSPLVLHDLSAAQWTSLLAEIEAFSNLERRRIFHLAYERRFTLRALDAFAIKAERKPERVAAPRFQAVFCIDAREESFRRHLEEVSPDVETFGTAGFFNVPIYYRGVTDAYAAALCPVVMTPQHWVGEEPIYPLAEAHRFRTRARRAIGTMSHRLHVGSRSAALGALLTGGFGMLASFPLLARVLFPRLTARFSKAVGRIVGPPLVTRLALERTAPNPGPAPDQIGFSVEEMAGCGERVLRDIGLTSGFARLVIIHGHASRCMNNPHKSTYDCGACSGPGGPNARALAMFLNDPRVRELLADRGLNVPKETIFLGAQHNTTVDSVLFYDLDLVPRSHLKDFETARAILEQTCERNARERCRRFYSAPLTVSPAEAKVHVENRAEDLAQVRPEFGNASNAICFVGRRERTRGLFLDRRSFLQSYDPQQDDAKHSLLARILAPTVPVCQGINLQYTFSAIDPDGWGAGSKLPHNVASLLGVMNGAASDLRLGLPLQSTEIHEPLRILFVIEASPETMFQIMEQDPVVGRIFRNEWAQLAVLDPDSSEIRVYRKGQFHRYHPETTALPRVACSTDWFIGSRRHLDFADIGV